MPFKPLRSFHLAAAITTLGAVFLTSGCSAPDRVRSIDKATPTMVLYNAPPTILQSNSEREAAGVNAMVGWHAALDNAEGPAGETIGHCNGTMQITKRGASSEDAQHRMTMIELDWDDSPDSLVVGGSHPYPTDQTQSRTPIYRAIMGGTGRFVGAMGEVISTKLPSGWYRHEIWLVD
jgi:hypothetical protein